MKTMGLKLFVAVLIAIGFFFMTNMFRNDPEDGPNCLPLKIFCTNAQP